MFSDTIRDLIRHYENSGQDLHALKGAQLLLWSFTLMCHLVQKACLITDQYEVTSYCIHIKYTNAKDAIAYPC